jgi:hypothetical protein
MVSVGNMAKLVSSETCRKCAECCKEFVLGGFDLDCALRFAWMGKLEVCEITGSLWNGNWVVKYHDWHWLKTPIPFKGFQGIKYLERLPDLKKRLEVQI